MNTSSASSTKLGTWFDSILDLFVWVGFPPQVAQQLLLTSSSSTSTEDRARPLLLPSLSTFFTRAIMNNRQPPDWYERYTSMNYLLTNNNNINTNSNRGQQQQRSTTTTSIMDHPGVTEWCDGIRNILEKMLLSGGDSSLQQNEQQTATKDYYHSSSSFMEAPFDSVCGKAPSDRSYYLLPESGNNNNSSIGQFVPFAQATSNTSSSNDSQQQQRNVSAVVSLIVDGYNNNNNNNSRNSSSSSSSLAQEVFGKNTNAVVDILSSIGLIHQPQTAMMNNNTRTSLRNTNNLDGNNTNDNSSSASSVNGLLWTTLGSPQLQRCVLLQAAIFYVLKKLCGLNFVVDETTKNWKCDFSAGSSTGASLAQQISLSVSVLSGLISLSCLDEQTWYEFPVKTNNNNNNIAVPSLLHVLSVLGFVSLTRLPHPDNNDNTVPVFKVLPEFRDAMLCTGAVDLKPSLLVPSTTKTGGSVGNNNFGSISSSSSSPTSLFGSSSSSSVAATDQDCVVVETNFRVYVHLVPVRNPYYNPNSNNNNTNLALNPPTIISHRGETLLAVLRTFLEQEELVKPIFAVFRLTRESFLRALRRGLTTDAIIRFLEAKSHPMAVSYYSAAAASASASSSSSTTTTKSGVPKALRDQMLTWGKEAERIALKQNHVMLTFPTSSSSQKLLSILAQRLNGENSSGSIDNNNKKSFAKMNVEELMSCGALPPTSVFVANAFQIVLSEKLWPLVSDLLPNQ